MPTAQQSSSSPASNSCQDHQQTFADPIETYGGFFSSGATIELIRPSESGAPLLQLCDGKDTTIGSQIEYGGRLYRPADLSSSIERVVRFPDKSADFGSTTHLFEETLELFSASRFPSTIALAATYFVFATWFADVLPAAPFLFVTGSRLEAALLFRFLSLMVRHPLPISEFNRRALTTLPMQMGLTFLVTLLELRPASAEMLRVSNRHGAWLSVRGEVVDVFSAKAVFCEDSANNPFIDEVALHIHLPRFGGALTNRDHKEGTVRDLQAKFLAHRCRNILQVRDSQFDLPKFTSKTRMLAQVLGAPLVDAPTLGVGLSRFLEGHEHSERADRWTDLRFVVLEAVLHHVHKKDARVSVGGVTQTVTDILMGRGSSQQRDPREIGNVLRNFGLAPKRYAGGYAIALDSAVSRDLHSLAREFGLLNERKQKFLCALCTEI